MALNCNESACIRKPYLRIHLLCHSRCDSSVDNFLPECLNTQRGWYLSQGSRELPKQWRSVDAFQVITGGLRCRS